MKITCPYCGNLFESSNAQCPHCLAPNDQSPETTDGSPSTIDELRRWYSNRHPPPYEVTRFYIGENVTEPRAFGICRDGERIIVYKNKDNGQRAIRYNGTDEGYAVTEFLNKLKDELLHQKQQSFAVKDDLPTTTLPQSQGQTVPLTQPIQPTANRKGCLTKILIVLAILLILSLIFGRSTPEPSQGYYNYNGSSYYYTQEDDNWYNYQNGQWSYVPNVPSGLFNNSGSYYSGPNFNTFYFDDYGEDYVPGFTDYDFEIPQSSQWNNPPSSSSSQWNSSSSSSSWSSNDDDDDWDWGGSDSWDSGYTDWHSDW